MNLLTIGGSDPSSGAGIQGDVRTFSSLGAYPLTIITSITSQNTSNFQFTETVSEKMIKYQISSLMSDFKIDGIKIGMVYDSARIKAIHKQLHKTKIPIVLDPVIKSTTGGVLLKKSALKDFREFLIPLSYIITPNKYEAELLSKTKITSQETLITAAKKIQSLGATNVIITGVEQKGKILDFVLEDNKHYQIPDEKISMESHGGGCTYSSAMLFSISNGNSLLDSVKFSKKFTIESIKNSKKIGKGIPITNNTSQDKIKQELTEAIKTFQTLPKVYKKIPECQTNFVFSKAKPTTPSDVLGVSGRIVKDGKKITCVGELSYGASKHVATALIEVNKKHPRIRSAINLRYQKETLSQFKKAGFNVLEYDRTKEPNKVKKSGSSVKWGINQALKSHSIPDVIYHTGDFGKEPMILVFAESPKQVIKKISELK